jgi:hypothetical protein
MLFFNSSGWIPTNLVTKCQPTHTRLDPEHVVVDGVHVEDTGGDIGKGHLGVVDAAEVARACGLVLLGLEGEGVGVDARVGVAAVVVVRLHLVKVLAILLLEAVLTVEDKAERAVRAEGTNGLLEKPTGRGIGIKKRSTRQVGDRTLGSQCFRIRVKGDSGVRGGGRHVPQSNIGRGRGCGHAPHKLLDGVVVGEADLGAAGAQGVNTRVLNLLDEVLVTLLGKSAALLRVEVHIVTPDLGACAEPGAVLAGQVKVKADLVVLEGDEGEVETGVAVEEEDQREEDGLVCSTDWYGRELTIVGLLGLVKVQLRVQAPPALVVLVNALTTNGQLNVRDGALSEPAANVTRRDNDVLCRELHVHLADEIAVAGNRDGDAAVGGSSAVDRLLDVLEGKVRVALVHRLEKGYFRVTGEVDILSTIRDKLHKSTSHFTLPQHFFWDEDALLGPPSLNNRAPIGSRSPGS